MRQPRLGIGLRTAAAVLALIVVAVMVAPLLAPQNPFDIAALRLSDSLVAPALLDGRMRPFPLGADAQGRDVLSAILYGARLSLLTGALAVVVAALIGVPAGLAAGFGGRFLDAAIMRLADAQLAVPSMLLALLADGVARALLPRSWLDAAAVPILVLAIGLARWPHFARVVRASTQLQRGRDYVAAARLAGRGDFDIALDHILPNVADPALVIAGVSFALAVMDEATLSFLGVGLPPTHPSLGTLIRVGSDYLLSGQWWVIVFPALALAIPVVLANVLADALRDRVDPAGRTIDAVHA